MRASTIHQQAAAYEAAFNKFTTGYGLPSDLFERPDHLAIKCSDIDDYRETLEVIQNEFSIAGLWEATIDNRSLASALLTSPVALSAYEFSWLEIMQPRPGKELSQGFVEHTEFVFFDTYDACRTLTQRTGEVMDVQHNAGHAWVNVPIGDGREIKFNDKPLAGVVEIEKLAGLITTILEPVIDPSADIIPLLPDIGDN